MGVIHWRLKNICLLGLFVIGALTLFKLTTKVTLNGMLEYVYKEPEDKICNENIRYVEKVSGKKKPVIGLLGPPGSGVVWLRYLVEQLSGLYTGSSTTQYSELFQAEGKSKQVVVMMGHDVESLSRLSAAIIVYRSLRETVRSQFAAKHNPEETVESAVDSYYGKDWENFVMSEGALWAQRYEEYIKTGIPVMIVNYEDLIEPAQLKKELLHISHFLRVPIRHSVLDCLLDLDVDLYSDYRPKALRYGFRPMELIPESGRQMLEKYENKTNRMIGIARDNFVPRIHG